MGKAIKVQKSAGSGRLSWLSWLSGSWQEWQLGLAWLVLQPAWALALAENEPEPLQHYLYPLPSLALALIHSCPHHSSPPLPSAITTALSHQHTDAWHQHTGIYASPGSHLCVLKHLRTWPFSLSLSLSFHLGTSLNLAHRHCSALYLYSTKPFYLVSPLLPPSPSFGLPPVEPLVPVLWNIYRREYSSMEQLAESPENDTDSPMADVPPLEPEPSTYYKPDHPGGSTHALEPYKLPVEPWQRWLDQPDCPMSQKHAQSPDSQSQVSTPIHGHSWLELQLKLSWQLIEPQLFSGLVWSAELQK